MPIKTIIFDFDGTIADSLGVFIKTYNDLAGRYGYKKAESPDIFRYHSTFEFITKVIQVPFYRLPFYYLRAKKIFRTRIHEAKPFLGMKNLLDVLAKKYTLGLLTSNFKESITDFVKRENIDDFAFIFSGASIFGKHHDIKKVMKERGLKKEEIIYIGDELRDIHACNKIGVKIIAVTWGFDSRWILERGHADYIVETPKEILSILMSGNL
jgi:phosphoglycolate phosphatase